MRIRPPRSHEDRFHIRIIVQIVGEGFFHALGVAGKGKVACCGGRGDEVLDFLEGVPGNDVDALDLWGI